MPLMRVLKLFTRWAYRHSRADSGLPARIFAVRSASAGSLRRVASKLARFAAGFFAHARISAGVMFVSRLKMAIVSRGQEFTAWTPA